MFKYKVYISYPEENKNYAKWLKGVFEINGIEAIVPDYSGYDIMKMSEQIQKADKVLIICSRNMTVSGIQSKETEEAFTTKKDKIISVLVEKCNIEGQYNYYFTAAKRFEIYKEKAKVLQSIIGYIKSDENVENPLFEKGQLKYDVSLLSEEDIDNLLKGNASSKGIRNFFSPFFRMYSRNETVNYALKCYSWIFGMISGVVAFFGLINMFDTFNGSKNDVLVRIFLYILVFIVLFMLWNLSYFPAVYMAKLRIKSKPGIVAAVILSLWLLNLLIELIW